MYLEKWPDLFAISNSPVIKIIIQVGPKKELGNIGRKTLGAPMFGAIVFHILKVGKEELQAASNLSKMQNFLTVNVPECVAVADVPLFLQNRPELHECLSVMRT